MDVSAMYLLYIKNLVKLEHESYFIRLHMAISYCDRQSL